MANGSQLPEGFVLDPPAQPSLPPGFVLDAPQEPQAAPTIEDELRAQGVPESEIPRLAAQRKAARGTFEILPGFPETAATVTTAALAEPVAGLGGLAGLPMGIDQAVKNIESIREALTFQPRTEAGEKALSATAGLLSFIGDIERGFGEKAFEATESPLAAAIATALPTAIGEALGIRGLRRRPRGATEPSQEVLTALREADVEYRDLPLEAQQELLQLAPEAVPEGAPQIARRQAFEQVGLTGEAAPTRAQVARTKELFMQQQDLAKRTNLVNRRLEAQDAVIQGNFSEAIDATTGRTGLGGASAAEAVTDKALTLDRLVGEAYRDARQVAQTDLVVRPTDAAKSLQKNAPLNTRSQGTVKALRDEMRRMGLLGDRFKVTGRVDVESAEQLRQFANSLHEGGNPQARTIIRDFKDSLDADVMRGVGEDVFTEARAAKRQFEEDLSRVQAHRFDRRRTSLVRDVLENQIDPAELFNKAALRGGKYRAEDLRNLRDYLQSGTPQQQLSGQIAWNDLRAEALDFIRETASKGAPLGETEVRAITRNKMQRAIDRIGPQKMEVLFTPQERGLLDDILRVAALREPPSGTFIGSGPSAPAIQQIENRLAMFSGLIDQVKNRLDANQMLRLEEHATRIEQYRAQQMRRLKGALAIAAPGVIERLNGEEEEAL